MLPVLKECKTIEEVRSQSREISTMATDLLNEPIVQNGYMQSGQPGQTAFINAASMAKKRLQAYFPTADWKDPLYERLMAEAKYICARCIHLKYECRERRQPYDHIKDATESVKSMVARMFNDYNDTIKRIEASENDSSEQGSGNQ